MDIDEINELKENNKCYQWGLKGDYDQINEYCDNNKLKPVQDIFLVLLGACESERVGLVSFLLQWLHNNKVVFYDYNPLLLVACEKGFDYIANIIMDDAKRNKINIKWEDAFVAAAKLPDLSLPKQIMLRGIEEEERRTWSDSAFTWNNCLKIACELNNIKLVEMICQIHRNQFPNLYNNNNNRGGGGGDRDGNGGGNGGGGVGWGRGGGGGDRDGDGDGGDDDEEEHMDMQLTDRLNWNWALIGACIGGKVDMIKWIVEHHFNESGPKVLNRGRLSRAGNSWAEAFEAACLNGQISSLCWLLKYKRSFIHEANIKRALLECVCLIQSPNIYRTIVFLLFHFYCHGIYYYNINSDMLTFARNSGIKYFAPVDSRIRMRRFKDVRKICFMLRRFFPHFIVAQLITPYVGFTL